MSERRWLTYDLLLSVAIILIVAAIALGGAR
jgi:hypothetical protein